MNFDILDVNEQQIRFMCNNIIYQGIIHGTNRAWYTLSGNVTQNDGVPVQAEYRSASWRTGVHPFNPVTSVRVNPLPSGDVDIYIN